MYNFNIECWSLILKELQKIISWIFKFLSFKRRIIFRLKKNLKKIHDIMIFNFTSFLLLHQIFDFFFAYWHVSGFYLYEKTLFFSISLQNMSVIHTQVALRGHFLNSIMTRRSKKSITRINPKMEQIWCYEFLEYAKDISLVSFFI